MPLSRRDVKSVAKDGSAGIKGDVTLSEGTGVTLTQTGQDIEIAASAGTGIVESVVAGNNIDVDATDPANPIVAVETLTLSDISDVTATATEVNYTDGVTSSIQTQLDTKAADSAVVKLTGNQTIAGVKTFSSNPVFADDITVGTPSTTVGTIIMAHSDSSLVTNLSAGQVGGSNITLTLPTTTDTLVGKATTDTLTNKTLTTPTIGSFTNATHNHTNAAGGGQLGTAALTNASVTADKLSTGAATDTVATQQTTTSTTFTDLATTGPSVTVTIGANGLALVSIAASMFTNAAGGYAVAGFVVSGANTIAADNRMIVNGLAEIMYGNSILLTGLTPGSTTFKLQYRVIGAVTGTFSLRSIAVIPL